MATPSFRVETGILKYRICYGEHEGPLVEYGDPATLVIDTAIYYCLIVEPDLCQGCGRQREEHLGEAERCPSGGTFVEEQPAVMRVDQVAEMATEYEDVTIDGEDDDDAVADEVEGEEEEDEEGVEVE